MIELRPNMGSEAEFVERVNTLQRPEGYRLVGVFVEGDDQPTAVAGFRTVHSLVWGYALYCDDLSTRTDHHRRGYAGTLVDWMMEEARRLGCDQLHLDSGVQRERQDAHRLYFNKGLRISAYHFESVVNR
ncbi:MAG: GNAT family N-acetyltransferase [Chloroflexi bacterium]|nr:GNAT family N-acetyltransferase [Chloroflexota bacterium]